MLLVTHYERLLELIVPDRVHVLAGGRIVKSGDRELARELDQRGYDWLQAEPRRDRSAAISDRSPTAGGRRHVDAATQPRSPSWPRPVGRSGAASAGATPISSRWRKPASTSRRRRPATPSCKRRRSCSLR